MNEVLKNIRQRRSCRQYQPDRQVPEELLQQILEAGTWAPSGMGAQSPVLVAVQDQETRDLLSRINAAVLGSDGDPFYGAPTVVVVLVDSRRGTCVEDGSLAMGNMMLAAASLGIGSCWIHRARETFDRPEGKALLKKWGLPETYIGVGNCILGYAAAAPAAPKPRKPDYILRV